MIDNYRDLPIGKYDECMRIAEQEQDTEARNVRILSVLTDKSEDELLLLPLAEFGFLMRKAQFLLEEPQVEKVPRKYNMGKWTLYPTTSVDKMVAGQFIDFQNISKSESPDMASVLSCFLIPYGYQYNTDYDITEIQDVISRCMPTTQAFSLSAFFLTSAYRWLKVIQIYSAIVARRAKDNSRAKEIVSQSQQLLKESGDGWLALMPYPRLHGILGRR